MAEEESELKKVEMVENTVGEHMKPWEQHSGVISIPRYDYNAPSSILQHSHSGFLITCTIKREKSATKEAISILEKFVGSFNSGQFESHDFSNVNANAKRRKTCTKESDEECINGVESKDIDSGEAGSSPNDSCVSLEKEDTNVKGGQVLSLAKLTRSGLVLLTFSRDTSPDTVDIVSTIIRSLETRNLKSPLWCHRIFPIQATCCLKEKELHNVVSKLVLQFVNDKQNKLARPIKFAVGYNRRGIEEAEIKGSKASANDSNLFALLDRKKCFDVVAAAVKDVVSDSVVDLTSPELCVLVEFLPLSGIPNGSLVVAVSVLPESLVSTKPRLCIKALVPDKKAGSKKS